MNAFNLFLKLSYMPRSTSEMVFQATDSNLLSNLKLNALGYLPATCSFLQSNLEEEKQTSQIKPTESNLSANTRL